GKRQLATEGTVKPDRMRKVSAANRAESRQAQSAGGTLSLRWRGRQLRQDRGIGDGFVVVEQQHLAEDHAGEAVLVGERQEQPLVRGAAERGGHNAQVPGRLKVDAAAGE